MKRLTPVSITAKKIQTRSGPLLNVIKLKGPIGLEIPKRMEKECKLGVMGFAGGRVDKLCTFHYGHTGKSVTIGETFTPYEWAALEKKLKDMRKEHDEYYKKIEEENKEWVGEITIPPSNPLDVTDGLNWDNLQLALTALKNNYKKFKKRFDASQYHETQLDPNEALGVGGKACGIGLLIDTDVPALKPEPSELWREYQQRIFGAVAAHTGEKNGASLIMDFIFSPIWENVSGQGKLKHLINRLDYALYFKLSPAREIITNYLDDKSLTPAMLDMFIQNK